MITDAHLKMELKFHNSVILSKSYRKSSKVDQVIFFSAPIGIPNMKALAKILLRYLAHKKGTSRQRSGKGAIRKRFPLQKTEVGKNQTNNQVLIP